MLFLSLLAGVFVMVVVDAKHRHMRNGGEPMFIGRFKNSTVDITTKYNSMQKIYNFINRANGKVVCKLHPIPGDHNRLKVDKKCPFYKKSDNVIVFRLDGIVGAGIHLTRTFEGQTVKRYCSSGFYKLIHCQKEDFERTMLFNGRTKWDNTIWLNYGQFLHKLVCQCQIGARYKGYDYFTISFYGQCAGVNRVSQKTNSGCFNGTYGSCSPGDMECAGGPWRDALYRVVYDDADDDVSHDYRTDSYRSERHQARDYRPAKRMDGGRRQQHSRKDYQLPQKRHYAGGYMSKRGMRRNSIHEATMSGIPEVLKREMRRNGIPEREKRGMRRNYIPEFVERGSRINDIPRVLKREMRRIPAILKRHTKRNLRA